MSSSRRPHRLVSLPSSKPPSKATKVGEEERESPREWAWNPNADELVVSDADDLLAGTLGAFFFHSGAGTNAGAGTGKRKRKCRSVVMPSRWSAKVAYYLFPN